MSSSAISSELAETSGTQTFQHHDKQQNSSTKTQCGLNYGRMFSHCSPAYELMGTIT
ncbi:hypothetical protein SRHO_G00052110 [Serrasalmus rhombeus]